MTAAWMLYVLLVGTLLACAALAMDIALRRTGMPTRWVWGLALVGSAVLAGIAPRGNSLGGNMMLPSSRVVQVAGPAAHPGSLSIAASLKDAAQTIERHIARGILTVERRIPDRAATPLMIAWGALSVGVFALLGVVNRRVDRARRAWPVTQLHGSAVRVAPHIGPAVVGVAHPEIVVPAWLLARSEDEQRLVIVHEREHVAARDQLVLTGAWCAAALLPWHPAVWWMLSRLRLAIELDCDARVLHRGVSPRPYGTLLIDIAGQCAGLRLGALALADTPTHLERRLLAMKTTRSRFTAARIGVFGSLAAVALLVACESRMPTSAEVGAMDASGAVKMAQATHLIDKNGKPPVYIVDGKVTPESEAAAIAPSRIASMGVWKSTTSAPSQVIISTVGGTMARSDAPPPPKGYVPLGAKKFDGVIMIDGIESTMEAFKLMNPGEIASVEVIKGPTAATLSTAPAAAQGVIRVTTTKSKP